MAQELEINDIESALQTCDEPQTLASYLTRLAALTSHRTEQFKEVQLVKPVDWLLIQVFGKDYVDFPSLEHPKLDKPLSDKKTEMIWRTTKAGQAEINLTFTLKRLEILYRSINRRLRTLETEWQQAKGRFI